jgi:hypothetical protein
VIVVCSFFAFLAWLKNKHGPKKRQLEGLMVVVLQAIGLIPFKGEHAVESGLALLFISLLFLLLSKTINKRDKKEEGE